MVDLHTHVLPGIDDGPADLDGSLRMAEVAASSGTRVLAATPHVRSDHPRVIPSEVPERVDALNAQLRAAGIDLEVVPGGEVALVDALERAVADLRAVTLGGNGRDLLVETPWSGLPASFETLLRGVRRRGFRVLLAHPEMNRGFQQDPDRLGRLADEGVLLQITAASLTAGRRSPSGRLARHALRKRWVHAIASDAHAAEWRTPSMLEGLAAARDTLPEAAAELRWLVDDAPRAILRGDALPERPAHAPRGRRWPRRK